MSTALSVPTVVLLAIMSVLPRVSRAADILAEVGNARVVTGDRAVWLTRGLAVTPEPAEIPAGDIAVHLDSVSAGLGNETVEALAEGIREFGWAQRETEPVGNSDRMKIRLWRTSDSVVVQRFDAHDRLVARAASSLEDGEILTERHEHGRVLDRTVYGGLLSPEMWIVRQEHLQKQFFESIMDLGHPGLEGAERAYDSGKLSLALYEVAEYFRRKTTPAALIRRPVSDPARHTNPAAQRVVDHVFTNQGHTVEMGDTIDWQTHPQGAPAAEWLWGFNGHGHFVTLLNGYLQTANEEYAREYVRQITDFIIRNPAPPYSITRVAAWRNLEAGERAAATWPRAFYGFLSSPSFTPQAIQLVLTGLWSHGNYIFNHPAGLRRPSNWSIVDSSGLCAVALYFPEFVGAQQWKTTAFDRLTHQLHLQVYEDGSQYELAPNYHRYCLDKFQRAMNLAEQTNSELPAEFAEIVESMYEYLMWLAKPDGTQPALSDSRPSSLRGTLREGARRFGREDFLFVSTGGREGQRPEGTSHLLPDAGSAVMRSDWGPEASYLLFDGGPVGTGHQHEDKLSILLSAYGVNFLVDTGPFVYTANKWRLHAVSTAAHSAALVDGYGQDRIHRGIEHYAQETPTPYWESGAERDYVVAQYDAGFGPDSIPVIHRRHVAFRKPDYWVLVDEFHGAGEHTIETLFQFAPGLDVEQRSEAAVVASSDEGPCLVIEAASADDTLLVIVEGQEDPRVLGWFAAGDLQPAPVAVYHTRSTLPVVRAYVLVPSRDNAGEVPAVGVRRRNDLLVVDVNYRGSREHFSFELLEAE